MLFLKLRCQLDKLGVSPSVMHCLYRQPEGRAFPANFCSRGRRRSPDRLTSTQTKLHQGLLRALPKDLRRTYLGVLSMASILCTALVSVADPVKLNGTFNSGVFIVQYGLSSDGAYIVYIADQTTNDRNELFATLADGSGTPVRLNGALTRSLNVTEFQISKRNDYVVYIADQNAD